MCIGLTRLEFTLTTIARQTKKQYYVSSTGKANLETVKEIHPTAR
ncbi:MAG: hypothetical protein QNJ54_19060 [Prochloraceae cyanobacterium]|nr:hypothetical protein [Prochloraceae cyanobacterium]